MLTLLKLRKFTLAWIVACAALLVVPNIADAERARGRLPQRSTALAKRPVLRVLHQPAGQSGKQRTGNKDSARKPKLSKSDKRFGKLMAKARSAHERGDSDAAKRYTRQAQEHHFNTSSHTATSGGAYDRGPIITPAPAASSARPAGNSSTASAKRSATAKTTGVKSRNERLAKRYYQQAEAKLTAAKRTTDPKKARQLLADAKALEAKAKTLDPSHKERAPRLATREIRERTAELGKEIGGMKAEHKRALRESRELEVEAKSAPGEQAGELMRNSRVRKAQAALTKAEMLRLQAEGLELKAQGHTDTGLAKTQIAKAERYRQHSEKIEAAVESYAKKHKLMEPAAGTAETASGREAGSATGAQTDRAVDTTSPATGDRNQVANASVRLLKQRLGTGNLAAATEVVKQLEVDAKDVGGLRGAWKRMRLRRARRLLRKGAEALGKADIQNGTLANAQAIVPQIQADQKMQREALKAEVAQVLAAIDASGAPDAQKAAERQSVAQQATEMLAHINSAPEGRPANNFDQARKTLEYLATQEKSYEGKPVRRVLANMWRLVRGSTARSNAKLDKALLKEIGKKSSKRLTWRGLKTRYGVEGAMQAQLLLTTAKMEGLNGKKTRRFNRLRKKAIKATIRSIKEAVKSGDTIAVENGYTALNAFNLESGEKFQVPPKQLAKMNSDMIAADKNFVSAIIKQANWLYKWRGKLQHMGDTGAQAESYLAVANERIDKMLDKGITGVGHLESARNALAIKLGLKKRHIVARAISLVAKPVTIPLRMAGGIVKFFTLTQIQALRYPATQGVPPSPVEQQKFDMLMQRNAPELYQQPGAQRAYAQAENAPPPAFDPYGLNQ